MNNLLFRVAEFEEQFKQLIDSDHELDQLIGQAQLKTLEIFKFHPIRSYEESCIELNKLNRVFKMEGGRTS